MPNFKPEGYPSLSPYMIVKDAETSLSFVEKLFGGDRLRLHLNDDGRVRHGEIRVGDAVLMVTDEIEGWPALPAHLHIYVPDVDATYQRALDLGAQGIQEPVRKDDADRRGGFVAPGGITWWVATQMDAA